MIKINTHSRLKTLFLIFIFSNLLLLRIVKANDVDASSQNEKKVDQKPSIESYKVTAEQVFLDMLESGITGEYKEQKVVGTDGKVTYGAEKEGSSSLITRVMGPNLKEINRYLEVDLTSEERISFKRNFLLKWLKGSYREKNVKSLNGELKDFQFKEINSKSLLNLDETRLNEVFNKWLEIAGDKWFSFVKPSIRRKIFNGELDGQNKKPLGKTISHRRTTTYSYWTSLYGRPEKYITNSHNTSVGWEINFNPMSSYAEFIEMKDWFSEALRNVGEKFGEPGHQRLVYPTRKNGDQRELKVSANKLAEIYKNAQAYLVLKGQEGLSGMETANYKSPATDERLMDFGYGSRNLLRLEENRFGSDTLAIEIRGGTKTRSTQDFIQMSLASRYAANDFEGIFEAQTWELIKGSTPTVSDLVSRFDIPRKIAEDAFRNLTDASTTVRDSKRNINSSFLTPFWYWENAPYLSTKKKAALKKLTRAFIVSAAFWKKPSTNDIISALQSWAIASNLTNDIKRYLNPLSNNKNYSEELIGKILNYENSVNKRIIDVNSIDLGIEYTARYPITLRGDYVKGVLEAQKFGWKKTEFDLTVEERKVLLEKVAVNFAKELGGSPGNVTFSTEQTHGNSLEMAYELLDSKGRKVRVEWDGIGRDYDVDSKVITESVRGGHIEVVTPKFVPSAKDIQAVFKVFKKLNLIPSNKAGGGHINIDLAPFEGNPKALARFITLFNNNKGIIALMFQHPQRLRSAEPIEIAENIGNKLVNFNGTEEELKKLLYDNRYFNNRLGRKSRYIQLDLSAYFQDVIPPDFIQKDFDIKNDPWRRNFNVDPKIRKAEFRLFNAPSTDSESAFQIRLVRGLLNYALNGSSEGELLNWNPQEVKYEAYVKEPGLAFDHLERLAKTIGLDPNDYKRYVLDGLTTTKIYLSSPHYLSLEQQLKNFPKQEGWGKAVKARSAEQAISSEGRILPLSEKTLSPDSHKLLEQRIEDRKLMARIREGENSETIKNGEISNNNIEEKINSIFNLSNRKNLPIEDQLFLLFSELKGEDHKKAKVYLKTLLSRSQEYDRRIKNGVDPTDQGMRDARLRKAQMEEAILQGFERSNSDYKRWLNTILDVNTFSLEFAAKLISHIDPGLHEKGYEYFKKLNLSEQLKFMYSAVYSETISIVSQIKIIDYLSSLNLESLSAKDKLSLKYRLSKLINLVLNSEPKTSKELIERVKVIVKMGNKLYGHEFLRLVNVYSFQAFIKNYPEESKVLVSLFSKVDKINIPLVAAIVLNSGNTSVIDHTWKILYKEFIPSLLSADKEIRSLAMLYLNEISSNYPDLVLRILIAAKMHESKIPAVQKEFFDFFNENKTEISSRSNLNGVAARMKLIIIENKDAYLVNSVIEILGRLLNPTFVEIVNELFNHKDINIRRNVSKMFTTPNLHKNYVSYALSSLESSDSVIRQNAEKVFTLEMFSVHVLNSLLESIADESNQNKETAKKQIKKVMHLKQFDSSLVSSLFYPPNDKIFKVSLEIYSDPNFLGRESIKSMYLNENTADIKKLTLSKITRLSDIDFIILCKDIIKNLTYHDELKMKGFYEMLFSRDLSQSGFGMRELMIEAFMLLGVRSQNSIDAATKILLAINLQGKNDEFFKHVKTYEYYNNYLPAAIALAKVAAKNINVDGIDFLINILKEHNMKEVNDIINEAVRSKSRSCKMLFASKAG